MAVVTSNLLLGQSGTLGVLVAAAVRLERINLALLGRRMAGSSSAEGSIKRAWRFTCNRRVEVGDVMAGVVDRITRRRRKRPLLISLDWTDVRSFHTLAAADCIGGRSLRRSRNALEERPLRKLRSLIPLSTRVIILVDRGFGRAEWAAVCRELSFHHVVRIEPDVTIACARHRGVLRKHPTFKGMAHVPRGLDYRKDERVKHNVVVRWRPGLPKKRDGSWYLTPDLDDWAERLCEVFARRQSVGGVFRIDKRAINKLKLSSRTVRLVHREAELSLAATQLLLVHADMARRPAAKAATDGPAISPRKVPIKIRREMTSGADRRMASYREALRGSKADARKQTCAKAARVVPAQAARIAPNIRPAHPERTTENFALPVHR